LVEKKEGAFSEFCHGRQKGNTAIGKTGKSDRAGMWQAPPDDLRGISTTGKVKDKKTQKGGEGCPCIYSKENGGKIERKSNAQGQERGDP